MIASYLSDLARAEALALEEADDLAAPPDSPAAAGDRQRAALEAGGWRAWYSEIFGEGFVSALAPHHAEAIDWHWGRGCASGEARRSGRTPTSPSGRVGT